MSFPAIMAVVLFNQDQRLKITSSPSLPLASSVSTRQTHCFLIRISPSSSYTLICALSCKSSIFPSCDQIFYCLTIKDKSMDDIELIYHIKCIKNQRE